jgi:eukaryotic-like serine/threonine-protein kinase
MSDPLIGRQFANYKIESVLGRGGMAMVYFARDVSLQRPVAVKVIDAQYRQNVSFAQRFISEARSVAEWRHENIIQVYYADQEDDLYYFVMEYIDGLDLEELLRDYADEGELMPHHDVIQIGEAIASAIDYAHEKAVVHRDIKPSNVMISSDNRVVLTDFGLALDMQQGSLGEIFGTPHYVSPEQARRSADAVPQSDIYSLGIMLYEMLTGVVPFDDPSAASIALQHLATPPPSPRSLNPDLNQDTEDVLLRVLAKEPADRYSSATELMEELEKALQQPADMLATAELPPLPPGMEAPRRSISSQSIMDRVGIHIQSTMTQPKPEQPRILETNQSMPAAKLANTQAQTKVPELPQTETKVEEAPPRSVPITWIGAIVAVVIVVGGLVLASGAFSPSTEVVPIETDVPVRLFQT